MVMRKIRTCHNECIVADVWHKGFSKGFGVRPIDQDRNNLKFLEYDLKKGELNLQRMFMEMGFRNGHKAG